MGFTLALLVLCSERVASRECHVHDRVSSGPVSAEWAVQPASLRGVCRRAGGRRAPQMDVQEGTGREPQRGVQGGWGRRAPQMDVQEGTRREPQRAVQGGGGQGEERCAGGWRRGGSSLGGS